MIIEFHQNVNCNSIFLILITYKQPNLRKNEKSVVLNCNENFINKNRNTTNKL